MELYPFFSCNRNQIKRSPFLSAHNPRLLTHNTYSYSSWPVLHILAPLMGLEARAISPPTWKTPWPPLVRWSRAFSLLDQQAPVGEPILFSIKSRLKEMGKAYDLPLILVITPRVAPSTKGADFARIGSSSPNNQDRRHISPQYSESDDLPH